MVQQKNVGFLLIDTHYSNSFRFFLTRQHRKAGRMEKERDVLVTFNFPFTREEYLPGKLMSKFPIVSP